LQFWEQLQKPRERAIYEKRSKADEDDEGLPVYTSPLATGSSTPAPSAPSDNPPGYDAWSKYRIVTPAIHILYISCIFQKSMV